MRSSCCQTNRSEDRRESIAVVEWKHTVDLRQRMTAMLKCMKLEIVMTGGEPLQIEYGSGYKGKRMGGRKATALHISPQNPVYLYPEEVALVEKHIAERAIAGESLSKTGAVLIDQNDPLLNMSHKALDRIEKAYDFPSSKFGSSRGDALRPISIQHRVLIIRERAGDQVLIDPSQLALTGKD